MAAVLLQDALFMPVPTSPLYFDRNGHRANYSGSITSGITSSDMLSRQLDGSMSNSQLLGNRVHIMASGPGTQLQYSYAPSEHPWTHEKRIRRSMRRWSCLRRGLSAIILAWVVYCTVRYFIAVRIYGGDPIRFKYALGMGIGSAFTIIFFASEAFTMLHIFNHRPDTKLKLVVHSLAYLSSALVLGLTVINLVLVYLWRTPREPAQFGRFLQGRCNWDLDVVWSGTGMACTHGHAMSFGYWLGAAVVRLVISVVLFAAYHLAVYGYSAVHNAPQSISTICADMGEAGVHRPSIPSVNVPFPYSRDLQRRESSPWPVTPVQAIGMSGDEHQRRSMSFTAAGQVLSRIEGSELDDEEDDPASSSSSLAQLSEESDRIRRYSGENPLSLRRSDSPEPFTRADNPDTVSQSCSSSHQPQSRPAYSQGAIPPNPPPSSFIRTIAAPSNDLQDFASAFRNLASRFAHDAHDGMALDTPSSRVREERPTVRVLGSYISRMSTIESMASRETAGSPVGTSSRSDTTPSRASGSRTLSRDPTLSSRGRDLDDSLATSPRPGTGSSEI